MSLIKHVHKQPGVQIRGFIWAPCIAQGTLPLGSHTKPLSRDYSAWLTVPVGTICTSYSSSFSGQFHLSSSPSVSNYLCITRGLCHSSRFEGGSCHVISSGMLYTSVSRDRMLSLLTDAFVSLQTATQKWSICGRENLSILYFNYFLPAFLMPGRGFSPRWCTNSVCISSKMKFPSQSARAKGNKKWHDLITSVTVVQQRKKAWHEGLIN